MSERIEVDSAYSDSSYETESNILNNSFLPSICEYRYEHGRRYHAYRDGKYVLPNDETEQDRLDIVHYIGLLALDGKLHVAPIGDHPQRILDVGTGTGIWAIEAGELYPSAKVIGTDLSPIQPSWAPENVQFQIDDAENEWTWPPNHFDFIHIRQMAGAIKDWSLLIKQAYEHLKPGGWLEVNEYDIRLYSDDDTLKGDMFISRFYDLLHQAAAKTGRLFTIAAKIRPFLEATGFEKISDQMLKLPLGTWPADEKNKELGAYFLLVSETGFSAFGMALLTRELNMSPEDASEVIECARKQAMDRSIHSYSKQYIYCGQKPESQIVPKELCHTSVLEISRHKPGAWI